MEDAILHRQTDSSCIGPDIVQILFIDLFPSLFEQHHPTIIETSDVASSNSQVDLADFDVTLFFCVHNRVVDTPFRRFEINDLALAYAARGNTSHPNDLQRSIAPR